MKKIYLILFLLASQSMVFAQQSSWKFSKGWAMRKETGSNEYKKFFAIGLWNIPGVQKTAMDVEDNVYRETSRQYLNKTDLYNMVFQNPGNDKDAFSRIEVAGTMPFYRTLLNYQNSLMGSNNDIYWQYRVRRKMAANPNDKRFVASLDSVIADMIDQYGDVEHVWAPIDEIVQGGSGAMWTWYPQTGEKIYERIKKKEPNTLVYTDLLGMPRGNYYLFEKKYMKSHKNMPAEKPPFDALQKDFKIFKSRETLGFFQGYDGQPSYINGTEDYYPYNEDELKDMFYNNMKICAHDYTKCGDVMGLNAFYDTNIFPILSGVSVDGIRAGVGKEKPIWLFFDGNGWARPDGESVNTFVQNLKCQIYTSIIHGATGIMFWNDRDKDPEVFNKLEKIVRELTDNLDVMYMKTEKYECKGYLNYMIKVHGTNRYLIATNTSKDKTTLIRIPGIFESRIEPLGVIFKKL